MENKEQDMQKQPLSEQELDEVNGGLSVARPALNPDHREGGNAAQGEVLSCQICGEKVMAYNMYRHLHKVHGI